MCCYIPAQLLVVKLIVLNVVNWWDTDLGSLIYTRDGSTFWWHFQKHSTSTSLDSRFHITSFLVPKVIMLYECTKVFCWLPSQTSTIAHRPIIWVEAHNYIVWETIFMGLCTTVGFPSTFWCKNHTLLTILGVQRTHLSRSHITMWKFHFIFATDILHENGSFWHFSFLKKLISRKIWVAEKIWKFHIV